MFRMRIGYLFVLLLSLLMVGCSSDSDSDSDPDDNGESPTVSDDPAGGGDTDSGSGGSDSGGGDSGAGGGDSSGGSSGSGDTLPSGGSVSVRQIGMVGVSDVDTGGFSNNSSVVAFASFVEFDEAFEVAAEAADPFSLSIGVCTVWQGGGDPSGEPPSIEPEDPIDSRQISAGETLSITSNGSSYLNLARIAIGEDAVFYGSEEQPKPSPMADNLRLNIPGDVFPSFTDVPVATTRPIVFSSPGAGDVVRFDTTFEWEAGNDADVLVILDAISGNTSVSCITRDTGSFVFPDETRNEMGTGFFASEINATRFAFDLYVKGEAGLMVYSASTN